ncbi:unnamed protein product [Trichogramma brassicae]|uniref:Uncharacterized protein n=1 Tax=Trichogramma brassicae TaxID=86971 RepID=A0A6H5I145_9HYME|nr:unnamed protein product [Trichogramma brassicae]
MECLSLRRRNAKNSRGLQVRTWYFRVRNTARKRKKSRGSSGGSREGDERRQGGPDLDQLHRSSAAARQEGAARLASGPRCRSS